MRKKLCILLFALVASASALLLLACTGKQATPEELGYTVRVVFDCNGGVIGSAAKRYMWAKPDSLLVAPGDKENASQNVDAPARTGYRFRGWYRGAEDESGNVSVDEARPWDFATDRVKEDVTLYAVWDRLSSFVIQYYTTVTNAAGEAVTEPVLSAPYYLQEDGGLLEEDAIAAPAWKGHTLFGYYFDEECSKPVTFPVRHTGGDADKRVVLYTDWLDQEYVLVRSASDMRSIGADKNYYLLNDIDFTGVRWTMPEEYNGTIEGNGHSITGVAVDAVQTRGVTDYGLFGRLGSKARIADLNLSASFTLTVGLRDVNTYTGLLAGSIERGCVLENVTAAGSVTVLVDRGSITSHTLGQLAAQIAEGVDLSACTFADVTTTLKAKEDE